VREHAAACARAPAATRFERRAREAVALRARGTLGNLRDAGLTIRGVRARYSMSMEPMIVVDDRNRIFKHYFHRGAFPFWLVHVLAAVGVANLGFSWRGVGIALAFYYGRMFLVTGAYHRYFSHRAYRTSRAFQLVLALLGGMCVQKGALWWAAHHRRHHKYSDTPYDLHSPAQQGWAWAHIGWILSPAHNETRYELVPDLAKYPELVWLDKHFVLPVVVYFAGLYAAFGWFGVVWGGLVSTVMLWHGTFTINSLTHILGRRRFDTGDGSLNSHLLAVITMGEGYHNNHHYYQSTANQGFYWWELDASYYVLRLFALLGLVWDLRTPPARVLALGRGEHAPAE
jgi:stearoyl-CoA desaturase (Delta-9 desaturase)